MKNKETIYNQIMEKDKMTIEEAEIIIDDMYQDRHKIIEERNDKGITIHLGELDNVKFTNLEFASVRVLREIQSLRREIEKKDKIIDEMAEMLVRVPNNSDNPQTAVAIAFLNRNLELRKMKVKQYFEKKVEEENHE